MFVSILSIKNAIQHNNVVSTVVSGIYGMTTDIPERGLEQLICKVLARQSCDPSTDGLPIGRIVCIL